MSFAEIKCAIGDLARPVVIYAMGFACAWAMFLEKVSTDKLTAGGIILAVLVGARTIDNVTATNAQAGVDKVKAAASGGTQP